MLWNGAARVSVNTFLCGVYVYAEVWVIDFLDTGRWNTTLSNLWCVADVDIIGLQTKQCHAGYRLSY